MKSFGMFIGSALVSFIITVVSAFAGDCPAPWKSSSTQTNCEFTELYVNAKHTKTATIRHGYLEANPNVPFLGNIIHVQGISDSMINHMPLFSALTEAGYRVISFDFPGQGGSSGNMNSLRMVGALTLAEQVWARDAVDPEKSKKIVMGWSSGGVAVYLAAAGEGTFRPNVVVLLAPSITPNPSIGEGLLHWPPDEVSHETLTTNAKSKAFLDPIRPKTPFAFPFFAVNIFTGAAEARKSAIPFEIKGFAAITGKLDHYTKAEESRKIILANAPHFVVKQYSDARHQIDNETPEIVDPMFKDIVDFLGATLAPNDSEENCGDSNCGREN